MFSIYRQIGLLVVGCVLLVCPATAQVGTWRGKAYTPESFPRASYCGCAMCQSLRSQWAQMSSPAVQEPAKTTAKYNVGDVVNGHRLERQTTYEERTKRVKAGCFNGVCYFQNVVEMVPVNKLVWVRVDRPKPVERHPATAAEPNNNEINRAPAKPDPLKITELVPTPPDAVAAMIDVLRLRDGEAFFDLGSGDGRIVIEAAKRAECLSVGIELNAETAAKSRLNAARAGVENRVLIFNGDATAYDLTEADAVTMYLYPELMAKLVPKLRDGTRVASFAHEIPGVECLSKLVGEHRIYWGVVGGKPRRDTLLTFGL